MSDLGAEMRFNPASDELALSNPNHQDQSLFRSD
jgi:hypothetical protein